VEVLVDELLGRGGLRELSGGRRRSGFLVELKRRERYVRVSLCMDSCRQAPDQERFFDAGLTDRFMTLTGTVVGMMSRCD